MLLITKSIVSIPEQTKNSSEQAENTYILVSVQFQCSVADVKQLCFSACVPRTWLEWFNQRNPASLLRIFSSSWHRLFIFLLNCSFNPWKQSNDEDSFMYISFTLAMPLISSTPFLRHIIVCGFCSFTIDLKCGTGCWEVFCGLWCDTYRKAVWGLLQAAWDWEDLKGCFQADAFL